MTSGPARSDLGVRACDAASFKILDSVESEPVDTFYQNRRSMA
ncbi:MAG: hypothetical protein ACLUOF_10675 [Ruminococcus sp.]